jgi:molecular chaperone DnaK
MYEQMAKDAQEQEANAGADGDQKARDNVVDAEYEEVPSDDKKQE